MSRLNMDRRSAALALPAAVLLAALGWMPGAGSAQDAPPSPEPPPPAGSEPAGSEASLSGSALPEPNLIIKVEGNRRWCVRKREPVWPAQKLPRVQIVRLRRAPLISSIAYSYYVLAVPEAETAGAAAAGQDPASATAGARAAEGGAPPVPAPDAAPAEGDAARGLRRPDVDAAGEAEEAAAQEEDAARAEELEEGGAPAAGQSARSWSVTAEEAGLPTDPILAVQPKTVVLTQSPLFYTMSRTRYQERGKPPQVRQSWEMSRTCCTFPTHVQAALPPGRYTLEVNFDVLMRRRGWAHVQRALKEGVEVREGERTELTLHVNTDGYVEIQPEARVVEFPAQAPAASPAETTPQQGPDPESAPAPAGSGAEP